MEGKNMEMKSRLKRLKNEKLECLSWGELESLIDEMLDNIGSIDPELRDHLIYPTFIRVIDEDLLTIEHFYYLLETCLDEKHLYYKLGEQNTDSVFTRSFSSLVIAGLLSKDRAKGLISKENIQSIFKRAVNYLNMEQDTRGYVVEKGWAHSVAHGADLLVSIVKHPNFLEDNFLETLNAIHICLFKEATYIDGEEERLIFIIDALIDRNIDENKLEVWVIQILNTLEQIYESQGSSNNYFRIKFNVANFLKTLYFRIGFKKTKSRIREIIHDNLEKLHQKEYEV